MYCWYTHRQGLPRVRAPRCAGCMTAVSATREHELSPTGTHVVPAPVRRQARITSGLVATVIFLTSIAPLATDMYVPAFPRVADDLFASATQVQLTLTTFFVGMALGQLIGGPVSDQRGRRRPLLAARVLMTAASIVCALTPSIAVMMAARLVQGFFGGWAMVIGRAIIVDLATGARLVRVLNVIAGVGGVAPIAGPLLGAVILQVSNWRGGVLAGRPPGG